MKIFEALLLLFVPVFPMKCVQNAAPSLQRPIDGNHVAAPGNSEEPVVGAARYDQYLHLLQGKQVALLVNHTSVVDGKHLVDQLLQRGVSIIRIFAPEHGFRGAADAGEKIADTRDPLTGLPIISLYGSKKRPSPDDLAGIDMLLFDIQDVGARFYTYISSMHYLMEACAEEGIPLIVLDRPNPNGHFIDGPVLDPEFRSFVGMHRIPVVHGLTVGELALMINGEQWLADGRTCDLTVVPCDRYDHTTRYKLPVPPSPNLPNARSIELYPSLCFFEGTTWSVGRGTNMQFQVLGHPEFPSKAKFTFKPVSGPGAKSPKHENKICKGYDLRVKNTYLVEKDNAVNIEWLVDAYRNFPDKGRFFLENNFIDQLAGTDRVRNMILKGRSAAEIRASWQDGLANYKTMRKLYLLYPDFE